MEENSIFLSKEEVAFLTGRVNAKSQRDQLDKQKIPYILNASGRPIVLRGVLISHQPKPKEITSSWQPNKR